MDQDKHLTILEIARLAKVSKGTVSKIINGRPGIGQETRKRVLEIVSKLGFTPNSAAQALANNRTSNIGLIVPHEASSSLNTAYWSTLITAVASRAAAQNNSLLLFTPRRERHFDELFDRVFRSRKVDGLIVGSELLDTSSMNRLLETGIPFVLVGRVEGFKHYSVDIDNHAAARAMTRHILANGYRNPAYLAGPRDYLYNRQRATGFSQTVEEAGISPKIHFARSYSLADTRVAVTQLLRQAPEADALFIGGGGEFLLHTLTVLKERELRPPSFGLAVMDDYEILDYLDPAVSAVHQPISEMGTAATQMLLTLTSGSTPSKVELIFPTQLTTRGSLGDL